MRYGLEEQTIIKIQSIFSQFQEIEKVILYGSRAKGNFKSSSDIDLTVVSKNSISLNDFYDIKNQLDELNLPFTFDVSLWNEIENNDLREHIERVGIVFYSR